MTDSIVPAEESAQLNIFTETYMPEDDFAELCAVEVLTTRTWAARRKGPGGRVVVGRKVYYRRDAVMDWLKSKETNPALLSSARGA